MGFWDMVAHKPALAEAAAQGTLTQHEAAGAQRSASLHPVLDSWYDQHMVFSTNSMACERTMSSMRRHVGDSTSRISMRRLLVSLRARLGQAYMPPTSVEACAAARRQARAARLQAAGLTTPLERAFLSALRHQREMQARRQQMATAKAKGDLVRSLDERRGLKRKCLAAALGMSEAEVTSKWPRAMAVTAQLLALDLDVLREHVQLTMQAGSQPGPSQLGSQLGSDSDADADSSSEGGEGEEGPPLVQPTHQQRTAQQTAEREARAAKRGLGSSQPAILASPGPQGGGQATGRGRKRQKG